jgi:hypothetical protein
MLHRTKHTASKPACSCLDDNDSELTMEHTDHDRTVGI